MAHDLVVFCLLLLSLFLGYRSAWQRSLLPAVFLIASVALAVTENGLLALSVLGLWLICFLTIALVWSAEDAQPTGRAAGALLGLAQGAGASLLSFGLIFGASFDIGTAYGDDVRRTASFAAASGIAKTTGFGKETDAVAYPEPLSAPPESVATIMPIIDWAEAHPAAQATIRNLPGEIRATDRAPLAFEVGGRVTQVMVDIGERFKAGDSLAQLDTHLLDIALQERRAALIEAEARLEEAQQEFERQNALFERNVVAEAVVEASIAGLDAARSRYEVALRSIDTAEDRLEDATLRAPYAGTIAERLIEPAQTVSAGAPAFQIQSDTGGFEVTAMVPDTLVSRLQLGSSHRVRLLDGSERVAEGVLEEIGSRTTSIAGFPVTLHLQGDDAVFRAGVSVEIAFALDDPREQADALAVPLSAVIAGDNATYAVLRYNEATGTLERVEVTLTHTDRDQALISHGLTAGDRVATRGVAFLRDGMAVTLRDTGVARFDD